METPLWGHACTYDNKFISICLFPRYGRAEVMAGFVNGLFLVFVAFFIFSEAVEVSVLFFEQIP